MKCSIYQRDYIFRYQWLEHLNPFSFADPLSDESEPREVAISANEKVNVLCIPRVYCG